MNLPTPIVAIYLLTNLSSQNRLIKQLFPHPPLPMEITFILVGGNDAIGAGAFRFAEGAAGFDDFCFLLSAIYRR